MCVDFSDLDWRGAHALLTSLVVPRPIALVSTVGKTGGFNVAPFSFYGAMGCKPALVYIGIGARRRKRERKDTIRNIKSTREFVISAVDDSLTDKMNQCGADYPYGVSEFEEVGLTPVKADLVAAPMVLESPINMECKVLRIMTFGKFPDSVDVVIGELLRVHIERDLLKDGVVDSRKLKTIARLGEGFYCTTEHVFELKEPDGTLG